MRKGEKVDHVVPTLDNYLRFLAYLVSVSYAPVFLMPRLQRYMRNVHIAQRNMYIS